MAEDNTSKINQERSPRFPSDSLAFALQKVALIYAELGRSAAPAEVVAKAMGYGSLSGASRGVLASLAYYGLLERVSNNHKVSDLALRIIKPVSDTDKAAAVKQAALEPTWFALIAQEHAECSEPVLANLLSHKGFTEDGAKRAAKIYKENIEFVRQLSDALPPTKGAVEPSAQPVPASQPPTVKHMTTSAIAPNELPVPIGENMIARIPFPMDEDAFETLIGTLNLWKKKLVKQPARQFTQEDASAAIKQRTGLE